MSNTVSQVEKRLFNLLQILGTIKPQEPMPLHELALLVGTNKEQLRKDLEILSNCYIDSLYIDIEIDDEDNVTLLRRPFTFSKALRLNDEQMLAVSLALRMSGATEENDIYQKLSESFAERDANTELAEHIRTTPPQHSFEVFETVTFAMQLGCALSFVYSAPGKEPERHNADVARITSEREGWYFHGYDHGRKSLRTFRLDRISEPEILHFKKSLGKNNFNVAESTHEVLGQAVDDGAATATLVFKTKQAFIRRDWPYANAGKQLTGACGGGYQVDVPLINPHYVVHKVISLGGLVTVKYPESLRQQVHDYAASLREAL